VTASCRALATVLFTDIVGSTDHAAKLRDAVWRDLSNSTIGASGGHHAGRMVLRRRKIYGYRRHTSQVVRYSTTDRSAAVVTTVECGIYVLAVRNN